MGKSKGKKKTAKGNSNNNNNNNNSNDGPMMDVDPARVRFQHSRIRPHFSGCGRSVMETLEEIREGRLQPSDLPPIQVIVGPLDPDDGLPWYFSLNNRRLWVLKRCREEGLLENNTIAVRVREPKSAAEQSRYSLANCALEAKFMNEHSNKREQQQGSSSTSQYASISQTDTIEASQILPNDETSLIQSNTIKKDKNKGKKKNSQQQQASFKKQLRRGERDYNLLLAGTVPPSSDGSNDDNDDDDSSSSGSYRPNNPFALLLS